MAPFHISVIRSVFAASEHVAPQLAGRAAFELFCRTPGPRSQTSGERKAVARARAFMDEARHHRLRTHFGECVAAHEFRPQPLEHPGGGQLATVLVVHGWRSRTEYMRAIVEGFRTAGYRVISLDLPGHGGSPGRRLNMANAVAAVRVAADWFGPFAAIVGHSFGGAVAVNAAAGSVGALAPVATDRIVAIASPSSMPRLFAEFGRRLHLGPRSQSSVEAQVERLTGNPIGVFESSRQLLNLPLPVLAIHDEDDREVSADEARAAARAGDHVRLYLTKGLGHRRIISDPEVVRRTVAFVGERQAYAVLH